MGVDAVSAAILGLSVLLTTGVVTWKECLGESVAWDTLTWFAALIAMAGYLNKYGLIAWFSQNVVKVRITYNLITGIYIPSLFVFVGCWCSGLSGMCVKVGHFVLLGAFNYRSQGCCIIAS